MLKSSPTVSDERKWVVRVAISLLWLVGFFVWFQSFGFPNNLALQRSMIWSNIPFDVLDLLDPPVDTKAAPWSWLNLLQRGPYVLTASVIWLGAWGVGSLLLRLTKVALVGSDRVFFSLCLGLSIISLVTLLLGVCGTLNRGVFSAILITTVAGEIATCICSRCTSTRIEISTLTRWTNFSWSCRIVLITLIGFVLVQLLGAMTPQTDFDVVEYHLGGPKEWFLQGSISRLPHNVYTNFPFLTEMLILAGMVVFGDWRWGALAGQAVIAGFAPLTALGLYSAGRRWFSSQAGCIAALVYLTSPWTYRITIIAYVEGGLACYLFATIFAALLIRERSNSSDQTLGSVPHGLVFLCGAMAGSAMACKYTGLISVIIPVSALLVWVFFRNFARRRTEVRGLLLRVGSVMIVFLMGLLLTVGPWLLKNAIATGNPVYPLAYRIFGGKDRDEELDLKWRRGHASKTYSSWNARLVDLPVKVSDVMANNDWHSPLMFGLAPLSFWWMRRRKDEKETNAPQSHQATQIIVILWLYVAWQFGTWWLFTHHIDRFYVPMFSVVALLSGVGMTWPQLEGAKWRTSRWSLAWTMISTVTVIAAVLYNAQIMLYIGGFNAGRLDLKLAEQIAISPQIQWLNEKYDSGQLSPTTKILCVGGAGLFHARYPYLYNTVFDRSIFEQLCSDSAECSASLRPINQIRRDFQRLGITHIDVNWDEIERYRAPGSYGYTDFVQPERFEELQRLGLLGPNLLTLGQEDTGGISVQIFPVLPE